VTGWSKREAVAAIKPDVARNLRPHGLISNAWRWGAGVISAGAGLVSILSYTHSIKAKFDPDSTSAGALASVRWIGISPTVDTATSVGDTIQLAVTATDARGNALLGAPTVWSSADTGVASVDSAGTVVAKGGGATAIMVTIGDKSARSLVYVQQRPAALRIIGDSLLRVAESGRGRAIARMVDKRGYEIRGYVARWRSADGSVAAVDSIGNATAVAPGRTTFTATADLMVTQLDVEVYPVPSSLTLLSGDGQRAPAGRRVSQPVTVQVVSRSGRPIPGIPVRFALEEGAGKAEPQSDSSDAQGIARAAWTLGGLPGRQSLTVAAEGVATPTVVTAEAEPVAANTRVTVVNEHLQGPAGGPLSEPVTVRVTDTSGVALVDVPVAWAAGDDGSVLASESRTDSLGEARARWTLGPRSGTQRAYVQVGSARTVPRFAVAAVATAGVASKASLMGTPKYEGSVGKTLRPPVEIRVLDRAGNTVPGVEVTLLPTAGTVADSVVTTDSTGLARVRWILGRAAGVQHLTMKVEGIERPIEVTARARAAGPANLAFVTPKPGTEKRTIQSLDVDVTDAYGNPVADQPVVFSTKFGSVSPSRVMTDSRGRAHTRWTPASKVGKRTLVAVVKGTDARATFVLEPPAVATPLKTVATPVKPVAPGKKENVKRASR
jgi:Big-like domain-containing protein